MKILLKSSSSNDEVTSLRQRLDSIETETKKRELNENFSTTRLNER